MKRRTDSSLSSGNKQQFHCLLSKVFSIKIYQIIVSCMLISWCGTRSASYPVLTAARIKSKIDFDPLSLSLAYTYHNKSMYADEFTRTRWRKRRGKILIGMKNYYFESISICNQIRLILLLLMLELNWTNVSFPSRTLSSEINVVIRTGSWRHWRIYRNNAPIFLSLSL